MTIDVPVITKDGMEGYDSTPLFAWMDAHGYGDTWASWINGQTGAIMDGKFVVYKSDVDRFLAGLLTLD